MWPRQDTGVNRRPSQTNPITILEAILTAFLGQSWKFQEHGFNIYVRCLAIWRIIFFTWKSDFYPSQLSIRKGLENCGFPRTFQQNNLLFSSHKNSRIRAFCSPRVGCATPQGWKKSQWRWEVNLRWLIRIDFQSMF